MTTYIIERLEEVHRDWVVRYLRKSWGDQMMVTRGRLVDCSQLPGFRAVQDDEVVGLVTYEIRNNECEIISLDSMIEGIGVGTALIDAVKQQAIATGCKRLWLITTNDNMHALRFYQKRGFVLVAVYPNAIEESRKLKPHIPKIGIGGIPIRDEIELDMKI